MSYKISNQGGKYCVVDASGARQSPLFPQQHFANDYLRLLNEKLAEEKAVESDKPKRARKSNGKLKADDPATPDVNEAWEGGKAPAKKKAAPKKKATKKK